MQASDDQINIADSHALHDEGCIACCMLGHTLTSGLSMPQQPEQSLTLLLSCAKVQQSLTFDFGIVCLRLPHQ